MGIKSEVLRPVRFGIETTKLLGMSGLVVLDSVMAPLSGPRRARMIDAEVRAAKTYPNRVTNIVSEMAERRGDKRFLDFGAMQLTLTVMSHLEGELNKGPDQTVNVGSGERPQSEYVSADYLAIVGRHMREAGFTDEEIQAHTTTPKMKTLLEPKEVTAMPTEAGSPVPSDTL